MNAGTVLFMDELYRLSAGVASKTRDEELIARCRARDADAFREVYFTYRTRVYRIAARMILNEADCEEITQDVFLQIFRSLENFKGSSRLSTWIHRIAMNVVLQHIRRKKSRINLRLDSPNPGTVTYSLDTERTQTPEESAVQSERRAVVRRCLAALSPKKRAVLVLYDFEGLSAKEISEVVNASVLTVRTRLFYARRELYKCLAMDPACRDLGLEEETS